MPFNIFKIVVLVIFIIIIFLLSLIGFNSVQYHNKLKIITGPASGSFYKLAVDYQRVLEERGFKVDIEPVANTSELVQRVSNTEDANTISFLLGPTDISSLKNVRSLGIVGKQPLFIFQNKKYVPMKSLTVLKGKRILLPTRTSITANISLKILDLYGVNEENATIDFVPLSEMYNKLIGGDYYAGFIQLTTENPLVAQMILNKNLNLFSYNNLSGILNKLDYLDIVQLSAGSFDILVNIPPRTVDLLVGNVEIIANKNINKSIVYTLLENFESLHNQRTMVSQAGEFPKYIGTQAKLHEIIQEYKKSGTPWFYKNFSSFYAMIINNYIIYFLVIFLLIEIYKNLRYLHELVYLCNEYISLKIIELNGIQTSSGQPLGNFRQIAQRWAVDIIERKTIRQKAAKMMVEQQVLVF